MQGNDAMTTPGKATALFQALDDALTVAHHNTAWKGYSIKPMEQTLDKTTINELATMDHAEAMRGLLETWINKYDCDDWGQETLCVNCRSRALLAEIDGGSDDDA